jgi:tetratricopeptide (TPR) repeat protein
LLETEAGRQAYTNNLNYARETYEELLAINADYAPAYRGLGEVYGKLGLPREAGRNYLEYVRRAPEAADRSIIVGRLAQIRDSLTEEKGNAND